MDSSIYVLILFSLISLSAFFSASETAFASANLIRLRQYAESGKRGAKKALAVAERFDEVLLAILIGNNVVNLSSASLATILFSEVLELGASGVPIATAVITGLILIFGEILPKSYAKEHAEKLALALGGIYYTLISIFKPLIRLFMLLKGSLSKFQSKATSEPSVTEDELNVIIDTMEEEGVLKQDEVDMIQSVLDLSDTLVKNIMTPRVDVVTVSLQDSVESIKTVFLEQKYSRIPVYDVTKDHIVGVLYERDLFTSIILSESIDSLSVEEMMHPVTFVSCSMRASDLLTRLRSEKQHLAVVVDEYGGTAGIVTMEDVLEEVVGEIYDEHDEIEDDWLIIKRNDCCYEAKANLELDLIFEEIKIPSLHPQENMSLGSWLYSKLEDIPKIGESYCYHHLIFTVSKVEDRRIKEVLIEIQPSEEEAAKTNANELDLNGE